jgi:hypothetical protein
MHCVASLPPRSLLTSSRAAGAAARSRAPSAAAVCGKLARATRSEQ